MERNRILGLVCGYYLSRFDELAYQHLGYGNKTETHVALGQALDVPPKTIQNWRDEFDPIHDNPRAGWHQRPMTCSRARTVDSLRHLSEFELHAIVSDYLANPIGSVANEILQVVGDETEDDETQAEYGLRGPTGHAAEELFQTYHEKKGLPQSGALIDCRHHQCGYDYRIESGAEKYLIEVKGLAAAAGGISFTNREWETAIENGDLYYLIVVKNIAVEPEFVTIQNPANKLDSRMRVYTTIQTSWTSNIAR